MFESIKMNIRHGNIDKSQFVLADIAEDIEAVLNSCFPNEQKVAEIKWDKGQNFEYLGIPAYTRNILINLIKNALYFIKEEKRGDISITLKKGEKLNELIFEDTAKGISIDALPKLFTRFSTTCRGGTGMGLAFCKMVMQGYGGDIVCESKFGKYTRFILTFPAIVVE
jgi:signal transduction histidine kinase